MQTIQKQQHIEVGKENIELCSENVLSCEIINQTIGHMGQGNGMSYTGLLFLFSLYTFVIYCIVPTY